MRIQRSWRSCSRSQPRARRSWPARSTASASPPRWSTRCRVRSRCGASAPARRPTSMPCGSRAPSSRATRCRHSTVVITPDRCTRGKAIGGGFPLAAIAGRADIMAHFDKGAVGEDAFMLQIGTLSGNPIAAAAGLKTLEILKRPGAYEQIFKTGRALMHGYGEILKRARVKARVVGDAPMFDVVFTEREVKDYRSAL